MRLIAFTGLPRSGKDTAAALLASTYGYEKRSFAAPLKEAAAILLNRPLSEVNGDNGFDREAVMPEWGFTMRWFLQRFGTECVREQIVQDFWLRRMVISLEPDGLYVITDCRFPNERNMVKQLGGIVVELRRAGTTQSGHPSDAGVHADYVISNDGTFDELYAKIRRFA
jgi:hypothetical protein